MYPASSSTLSNESTSLMSHQVSSTAKLKCAQLQIPNERTANNSNKNQTIKLVETKLNSSHASKFNFRYLFEDSFDKLKEYIKLIDTYKYKIKSFSTSDILHQNNPNDELCPMKRYLSECDLKDYSNYNSNKEITNDYVTYSCSTLAICGDTLNSSQLPSPQTQSIKQINNSFISDLDLIKSINKKFRNECIKKRIVEFIKSVEMAELQNDEVYALSKISSNDLSKPLQIKYLTWAGSTTFVTENNREISINVVDYEVEKSNYCSKQDKKMFVLNWLQTVEPCNSVQEF